MSSPRVVQSASWLICELSSNLTDHGGSPGGGRETKLGRVYEKDGFKPELWMMRELNGQRKMM